ncbi:hypothetical protein E3N88_34252 [Mikania micrantha]|uniref:ARID domain-containing protein n=1 Tax=Mikania micrantha TaxID=192012 RepID=A0A5N6LY04_9ASTR|nr:hypothetical protein E3N88_34252 [Mikania micrantha]
MSLFFSCILGKAWVTFLDPLHIPNYVEQSKDYLREEFAKFVKWFYKEHFSQKDKKYPPKLPNDCAIELLDLYMYVEDANGYSKAAKDDKWPEIAIKLEFDDVDLNQEDYEILDDFLSLDEDSIAPVE